MTSDTSLLDRRDTSLDEMANALRFLTVDAVEVAQSGHPGMPMGMADVAAVLFSKVMNYDAADPEWPDRDRFVLSVGHGSMLLYGLLWLSGYPDITLQDLRNFRKLGVRTAGHPEYEQLLGVEATTGPLGQGIANAVGMALAERMLNAEFGDALVDHHTWVMAGDGCLMEGISQEAITFAAHMKLGKLVVLFDDNAVTIDGLTDHATSEDQQARFSAAGWHVQAVDGHDTAAIEAALLAARQDPRPSMIACRTVIGRGSVAKQGKPAAHFGAIGAEDRAAMQTLLNWPHGAFEIPESVVAAWRKAGRRGATARAAWDDRLDRAPDGIASEFRRRIRGELPEGVAGILAELRREAVGEADVATRMASSRVLNALFDTMPELVGGSADLAGSTQTWPTGARAITPQDYGGRYIPYGVREHGMAAFMTGIALHGGFIPFGGTFLCFIDYARPAVRLAAMMHQREIFVMTHDCITVGEDGPTHQPVEHLAGLRATPNLNVFRPGDMVEALECWELALNDAGAPTVLCLSRNPLPVLREEAEENLSARGGYVLQEASGPRRVTLLATGSELALAVRARETLEAEGIATAVVSMPNWRLFDSQPRAWRDAVLGPRDALAVAVEALSPLGWERYVGRDGIVLGVDSFGASAPAADVLKHFGFTPEAVVQAVRGGLARA
ncbi:transketolase [Salipiger sp.]|uniref:transketolase n=1 Tax=Salipiger sp. TaxID=2078585 RepID=UPI003A97D362